ncbi:7678_t:CDS:2 [Entrophospora sp. SA101]|nr:7678_t:CDS:2 [Entrophospora sp. SA101]
MSSSEQGLKIVSEQRPSRESQKSVINIKEENAMNQTEEKDYTERLDYDRTQNKSEEIVNSGTKASKKHQMMRKISLSVKSYSNFSFVR